MGLSNALLKITGDSSDAREALSETARGLSEIGQKTAEATVDVNTTKAKRSVTEIRKEIADTGNLTVEARVELQSSAAQADIDRVKARLIALSKQEASPKVDAQTARAAAQLDRLEAKLTRLGATETTHTVNVDVDRDPIAQTLAAVGRDIVGVVSQAGKIAAAGLVTQLAGAGAAGGVALVSALGPAVGLLGAVPGLALTGAQGLETFKLATAGITQAVGGLNKELDPKKLAALTPEARTLARSLDELKPSVIDLQRAAQKGLLPGLSDAAKQIKPVLSALGPVVGATGSALGDLARDAATLASSPAWTRDISSIGQENARNITVVGRAGLDVADALRNVVVTAQPLVGFLAQTAAGWAATAKESAQAGRESGTLAGFFEKTIGTVQRLFSILGSLGGTLLNVGKAAAPLGGELLASIDGAAASLERLTGSAKGQRALTEYFESAKPVIYETGRLVRDVIATFARLSNQPGAQLLVKTLRTELLPALEEIVKGTTNAFGPTLIRALTNVVKLFDAFVGSSGPLVIMVRVLGSIAGGLAKIADSSPVLQTLLVSLAGLAGVIKALRLTAAVTGVSTLVKAFDSLRGAEEGAAAAGARARVATLASAAADKVKAGATAISSAATTVWTAATNGSIVASGRQKIALVASTIATYAAATASGIAAVATTAFGLAVAVLTSPITLVVLAIAGLIAITVLIVKNWDTVKSALSAVWGFLKGLAESAFDGVKKAAEIGLLGPPGLIISHWGEVKQFLAGAWNAIKGAASDAFNAVKSTVTGASDGAASAVRNAFGAVRDYLSNLWTSIRQRVDQAWNGLKGAIDGAADGAASAVRNAFGAVRDYLSALWTSIRTRVDQAWDGLKGAIDGAAGGAASAVRNAFGAVRDYLSLLWTSIRTRVDEAWDGIKKKVSDTVDDAVKAVTDAGGRMLAAGRALIQNLINGIEQKIGAAIQKVRDGVKKIKDLMPGSEPKDPSSPLRGLAHAGRAIFSNMADGVPLGAKALVSEVRDGALSAADAATASAGQMDFASSISPRLGALPAPGQAGAAAGGSYSPTYHFPPAPGGGMPDPEYIAAQLEALLRDRGVLAGLAV